MGLMGVAEILKSADQDAINQLEGLNEFKLYVPIFNRQYLFSIRCHDKYTRSVI